MFRRAGIMINDFKRLPWLAKHFHNSKMHAILPEFEWNLSKVHDIAIESADHINWQWSWISLTFPVHTNFPAYTAAWPKWSVALSSREPHSCVRIKLEFSELLFSMTIRVYWYLVGDDDCTVAKVVVARVAWLTRCELQVSSATKQNICNAVCT